MQTAFPWSWELGSKYSTRINQLCHSILVCVYFCLFLISDHDWYHLLASSSKWYQACAEIKKDIPYLFFNGIDVTSTWSPCMLPFTFWGVGLGRSDFERDTIESLTNRLITKITLRCTFLWSFRYSRGQLPHLTQVFKWKHLSRPPRHRKVIRTSFLFFSFPPPFFFKLLFLKCIRRYHDSQRYTGGAQNGCGFCFPQTYWGLWIDDHSLESFNLA